MILVGSTRASSSLEIGQSVTGHEWTRHKDNHLRSRARAWCHCRMSSRLVRTTPLRALALCWQFQSDTGAPERDYPDLGHTEVLCDGRRVGSEVLGGLAWRQVDLHPPWRSSVRRHHSGSVHRLAAGAGVLGATQPAPNETVLARAGRVACPWPEVWVAPVR
jgi:hypothetical protein